MAMARYTGEAKSAPTAAYEDVVKHQCCWCDAELPWPIVAAQPLDDEVDVELEFRGPVFPLLQPESIEVAVVP